MVRRARTSSTHDHPAWARNSSILHSRRGFELTVSFFVILTLTVIIFAGSLYFLRQFYVSTTTFRDAIDRDTDAQLQALLRDGSIVAIPINKAAVKVGNGKSFWVGIQNVLGHEQQFGVTVTYTRAFDAQENPIPGDDPSFINSHWLVYNSGPHTIKNDDFGEVPVRIVVDREISGGVALKPGTYAFNVCVFRIGTDPAQKEYQLSNPPDCGTGGTPVDVTQFYTGKVYKIFVDAS